MGDHRGRPPGPSYAGQLREALGTDGFARIIQALIDRALDGDTQAGSILLARLTPPLKPSAEPVRLSLPDGTLAEQAAALVRAISDGAIAPSDAKTVMDCLSASAQLGQLDDLAERITLLERTYGKR
jgi:hypothetical protein